MRVYRQVSPSIQSPKLRKAWRLCDGLTLRIGWDCKCPGAHSLRAPGVLYCDECNSAAPSVGLQPVAFGVPLFGVRMRREWPEVAAYAECAISVQDQPVIIGRAGLQIDGWRPKAGDMRAALGIVVQLMAFDTALTGGGQSPRVSELVDRALAVTCAWVALREPDVALAWQAMARGDKGACA